MPYEEILYDVTAHVATVTLNRPDKLNAWTQTMEREVRVAMQAAAEDEDVRVIVLTGSLGAGKTTFTQGLGAGLGVRGAVTSPTFVIARIHPSMVGGPVLVHADAYRLGGIRMRPAWSLAALIIVGTGLGLVLGSHFHQRLSPEQASAGNPVQSSPEEQSILMT